MTVLWSVTLAILALAGTASAAQGTCKVNGPGATCSMDPCTACSGQGTGALQDCASGGQTFYECHPNTAECKQCHSVNTPGCAPCASPPPPPPSPPPPSQSPPPPPPPPSSCPASTASPVRPQACDPACATNQAGVLQGGYTRCFTAVSASDCCYVSQPEPDQVEYGYVYSGAFTPAGCPPGNNCLAFYNQA